MLQALTSCYKHLQHVTLSGNMTKTRGKCIL